MQPISEIAYFSIEGAFLDKKRNTHQIIFPNLTFNKTFEFLNLCEIKSKFLNSNQVSDLK